MGIELVPPLRHAIPPVVQRQGAARCTQTSVRPWLFCRNKVEAVKLTRGGMAAQVAHRRPAAAIHTLCFCVRACIPDAGKRRTLGGAVGPVDSSPGASVRK